MNSLMRSLSGFTFNNKHNRDVGVVMHSKSIQPPSKKKIKESVPFMNGSYDFSTVGSNGEINYDDREITVVLGLPADSKEKLTILYSKVLGWLMDSDKCRLTFDDDKMYYYMVEVEKTSTFEQVMEFGRLTVTFTAEPFKSSINYVVDDIWDIFNFEEDVIQDLHFDVENYKPISIFNSGRIIAPTINCSTTMALTINGITYTLDSGDNTFYDLKLQNGFTNIYIYGSGHIKFLFRKQVL